MRFLLFGFSSASLRTDGRLQVLSCVFPSCYCLFASIGAALCRSSAPVRDATPDSRRCCTSYSCSSLRTISKITSIIVSIVISRIIVARRYFNFYFYKSKVFYECLQTTNARRYDSLDPRLNFLESLFSIRCASLSHSMKINENK